MRSEPLAVILTADLSAQARGRAVEHRAWEDHLRKGSGWVPANLAIGAFGQIVVPNPFGSVGDLRLVPDASSESMLTSPAGTRIATVFGDLVTPDGAPWDCCPRTYLRDAIEELHVETGLRVIASFEHEFVLTDLDPRGDHAPFSLRNLVGVEPLGSRLMAALRDAGLEPEMWLPEYAPRQWEVPIAPAQALVAADRAILLREIVRTVAASCGHSASFSPILEENGGGSGVHIHLSLVRDDGTPVAYDPSQPGGLSAVAGSFAAGILRDSAALLALSASSTISYERLAPGRWSVGGAFLGENNREALLRICPLFHREGGDPSRQFNLEFRGADATSNPWLALGAIIRAGAAGIRERLASPTVVSGPDAQIPADAPEMPTSLDGALRALEANERVVGGLPPRLRETFFAIKRDEMARVADMAGEERYRAYAAAY